MTLRDRREGATLTEESNSGDTGRHLLRGLYMVLFFAAARVVGALVAVIALFQFVIVLIGGRPNSNMTSFGNQLSLYARQIILFMSYNTETRPWPFSGWPGGSPN